MSNRCSKRVFSTTDSRDVRGHDCTRAGKVMRDGKWFCTQHDPVRVKAQDAARRAEWERKWAEQSAQWARDEAERERKAKLVAEAPILRAALGEIVALADLDPHPTLVEITRRAKAALAGEAPCASTGT